MRSKRLRGRFRRQLQRQQQQVEEFSQAAEKGFERNMVRRFQRLTAVRRFLIGWIAFCFLLLGGGLYQIAHLSSYYQQLRPVPGGIYTEGILGTISNVNPIYASTDVDSSLSRLVFAGLFTYDAQNHLVGDLASGYKVASDSKTYTVTLKPGLTWQDGRPLTAADVVYTYDMIEDPDAQSPLLSGWQGVRVTATNPTTVTFVLPSPLAAFPDNLTTGILPKHLLNKTSPANLRSANFNSNPIGAGPFVWHKLQVSGDNSSDLEEQVALLPFARYNGGQPKLSEFIMHAYQSQDALTAALRAGQLTAASGYNQVPDKLPKSIQSHSPLLTAGNYVFFKTSSGVLADVKVRQALVAAATPSKVIAALDYRTRPVTEPLLTGQLAFNPAYAQKTGDPGQAANLLAQDGWQRGKNGILTKNGQPLSFNLVAVDTPEYRKETGILAQDWRAIGVDADVTLESPADYSTALSGHEYDATLYGISIGSDPDVFAYWDSSQADLRSASRLNLSEWRNPTADAALEAGRTRLDPQLRIIKYAPFLQAWQQDAPALGLYQPRYLYLTNGSIYGLRTQSLNGSTDRFDNVQDWEIRTARVTD